MMSERRFSDLLALIYEAAADFDRWPEALRAIARASDAPMVVFVCVGPNNEPLWQIVPDLDSEYIERYAAYYHRINPLWRVAIPSEVGSVMTDEMMIERREFARTEFFNDFLTPLGLGSMLGAKLRMEGGLNCAIVTQRRRGFSEQDLALYRRLAPHLVRAVQLNVRLSGLEGRCAATADALDRLSHGAIVVDAQARVLFANREAERLVGPSGCLRIQSGVLQGRSESTTAKLKTLIAGCAAGREREAGGALQLPCDRDRRAMSALVLPLRGQAPAFSLSPRPAAVVFVTDPGRTPDGLDAQLRRRFGLTPAEANFAMEVAKGDGLQASADRIGISLATARTHLAHVFAKTEVRRQAELTLLVGALSVEPV
jgi:DNA-binding CsgD family transcriptional regulator/PAS domain-containing protein